MKRVVMNDVALTKQINYFSQTKVKKKQGIALMARSYLSQTKEHKETVFHYCASEGNVAVLEQVLQNLHQGQIQLAVNKQSVTGWSPLIVSSSKGHLEIVKV